MGWSMPTICEMIDVYRTKLTLPMGGDKKTATKNGDKRESMKTATQKAKILSYIRDNEEITTRDVQSLLNVGQSRSRELLGQSADSGKIAPQGDNRNRSYRLARNKREE